MGLENLRSIALPLAPFEAIWGYLQSWLLSILREIYGRLSEAARSPVVPFWIFINRL